MFQVQNYPSHDYIKNQVYVYRKWVKYKADLEQEVLSDIQRKNKAWIGGVPAKAWILRCDGWHIAQLLSYIYEQLQLVYYLQSIFNVNNQTVLLKCPNIQFCRQSIHMTRLFEKSFKYHFWKLIENELFHQNIIVDLDSLHRWKGRGSYVMPVDCNNSELCVSLEHSIHLRRVDIFFREEKLVFAWKH